MIRTDTVYLSLGDREEKTRNPVMATVGDRIREAHVLMKERGVNCILEWNEGNHFRDADLRTAKAFAWVLNNKTTADLHGEIKGPSTAAGSLTLCFDIE